MIQLAPKVISLPTQQADRIDNSTPHNLILLTPIKIGCNPSNHKAFTAQAHQLGPAITQECPMYNQSTKPSPLEAPTPLSPRLTPPKSTTTPSSQINSKYSDPFPHGLQFLNSTLLPEMRLPPIRYPISLPLILPHYLKHNPKHLKGRCPDWS